MATLRFMPQSSLPVLDPMFSSEVAELTYLIQRLCCMDQPFYPEKK